MSTVAIVYFSGTGHTRSLAQAVATGVASIEGTRTDLITIEGRDIHEGRWRNDQILSRLTAADAIIFGSPTYMGSVAGQIECFLDATAELWMTRDWRDKVASAFTVSGSPCGDNFNTLVRFATFAMQQGMIWVGLGYIPGDDGLNRLGLSFGAAGQAMHEPPEEAPNDADCRTGEALGRRVAEVVMKLATADASQKQIN
jgi:NAD(P)H dehydrogenase (quinone)